MSQTDLAPVYEALKKAHAAGDGQSAAKLASYIKGMSATGTAPATKQRILPESFKEAAQILQSSVGKGAAGLMGLPRAALDAQKSASDWFYDNTGVIGETSRRLGKWREKPVEAIRQALSPTDEIYANLVAQGVPDVRPETTAGRYAQAGIGAMVAPGSPLLNLLAGLGAEAGGDVGGELAGDAGALAGSLAGGLAGASLPGAAGSLRGLASASGRAERRVAPKLAQSLRPEDIALLEQKATPVPGLALTTAELTQNPQLLLEQAVQGAGLQGGDLMAETLRRQGNMAALGRFADANAPAPKAAPETVTDFVRQRQEAVDGMLSRQQADALQRRQDTLAKQGAALARQTGLKTRQARLDAVQAQKDIQLLERKTALDGQLQALRVEGKEKAVDALKQKMAEDARIAQRTRELDELEGSLKEKGRALAADLPVADRADIGDRTRQSILAQETKAREDMRQLAESLGLNRNPAIGTVEDLQEQIAKGVADVSGYARAGGGFRDFRSALNNITQFKGDEGALAFTDVQDMIEDVAARTRAAQANGSTKEAALLGKLRGSLEKYLDDRFSGSRQYREFRRAYRQQVIDRYENPTVRPLTTPATGGFLTASERVMDKFFRPGGVSNIREYKALFGDDPQALANLESVALDSLRKAAAANGEISPQAFNRWLARHADVLEEVPALKGKILGLKTETDRISGQLATAAKERKALKPEKVVDLATLEKQLALEQQRLENARDALPAQRERLATRVARAKARLDAATEQNALGMARLENAQAALDARIQQLQVRKEAIENRKLSSLLDKDPLPAIEAALSSPQKFSALVRATRRSPEASNALRRVAWDIVANQPPDKLAKALQEKRQTLSQVFAPEHLSALETLLGAKQQVASAPSRIGTPFEKGARADLLADAIATQIPGQINPNKRAFDRFLRFLDAKEHEVWRKALYDKDFALKLARKGNDQLTAAEVRSLNRDARRLAAALAATRETPQSPLAAEGQ